MTGSFEPLLSRFLAGNDAFCPTPPGSPSPFTSELQRTSHVLLRSGNSAAFPRVRKDKILLAFFDADRICQGIPESIYWTLRNLIVSPSNRYSAEHRSPPQIIVSPPQSWRLVISPSVPHR